MSVGVAVVSGGGSGIGRAVALELGRRGHPLALLGRRREPLLETLREAGGERDSASFACDVRDAEAVDRVAAEVERRWGAPEVLVPAAGVAHVAPLAELSPAAFAETVDTNLTGTFLLLRAFLPEMMRRGSGWVFPILSTAATRGFS